MIDFESAFQESYERVLKGAISKENEFFDAFYGRFIASSPLVEEKFRGVDMDHQKTMLKQSFSYLLNLFVMKKIPDHLFDIARKHDRGHSDIQPELYHIWLECLVETVREFDPKFNHDIELAWRMVCSQGIAFMIHMHRGSGDRHPPNGPDSP